VRHKYRTGEPLPSNSCILYIFSTNISTEYFKHNSQSPFFSSKCFFFHNGTFFDSCIIHILHTEVYFLAIFKVFWHSHLLLFHNFVIPYRKQQYQQNDLLGFSILLFLRNLIRQTHHHFPLQIWPQLRPYNNVSQFKRRSHMFRDTTWWSFLSIPWPFWNYCMTRGVFSSTKHIVKFQCALFVVPSYNARVNGS
jgi:hypothetical protein